ncbi:hypothetical protein BV378_20665 [Nostoc sp. RF31YmG]|nr:hypothetical protein BV378_20665 [Nostoc sp. RF31YmG]
MTKTKLRLSLPQHHTIYLQSIASQMGCDEAQALNYLLWELRRSNFAFGSTLPPYPMPNTQLPQSNHFDPNTFESKPTAMSGLSFQPAFPDAVREFEQVQEEIDPVIAKMALLIENF